MGIVYHKPHVLEIFYGILWLVASIVGSVQEIMDPEYLVLSFVGVRVESMNVGGVVPLVVFRYSVLTKLRNNRYRVASDCSLRKVLLHCRNSNTE